jgi:F-box-like
VKMSLVTYNQPNQLSDDVLLVIFDQLDDQDLLQCEVVCRQWRNVLLSGSVWKRLFRRQIVSSQLWRQVLPYFEVNVDKLETVHYRGLCRTIINQSLEIDRNWRTGKFKEIGVTTTAPNGQNIVTVTNDYVVSLLDSETFSDEKKLIFFDRRSQRTAGCTIIPLGWFVGTNVQIVVLRDIKNIQILDTYGQLMTRVPELDEDEAISWNLTSCCISGDQMAVLSQNDGQEKLSLWDVSDPSSVTRLKSETYRLSMPFEYKSLMKMDEEFIFITPTRTEKTRFYFFWKKTLELHWQKRFDGDMSDNFSYGKGLLLIYVSKRNDKSEEYGLIQVYDVKSRKCLREISITAKRVFEEFDHKVGFNSKFIVVAQRNEYDKPYKMNIYDLEAVKDPKSTEDELLVHTLSVEFPFKRISMDETVIICENREKIRILDFGSFDCFRNAANSVILSLPWRGVWRSKGVDEEPLEPVHHMEAYSEVLKYFHQLTLDCRAAIKTYPVVDPDVASFNLGNNFIGYRQRNPEMVIYDEEMRKMNCRMNYKTVQISKTTHVSVMGKTIQLIDVVNGNVLKETKLERDAIGFHFRCNLLVFVSQITENEHILSVWKVENNVDLTHVKDVTIGEYDFGNFEDSLQLDEHFIAVKIPVEDDNATCVNLISLKTFEIERSLSFDRFGSCYDGGYLFLMNYYVVRILDVASGTFLHDMPKKPPGLVHYITKVNSHYAVTVAKEDSGNKSKLFVYDLKCLSDENIYIVDLKPVDRLICPESC